MKTRLSEHKAYLSTPFRAQRSCMRGRLTALLQNSNNCDLRFATFPRLNAIEKS